MKLRWYKLLFCVFSFLSDKTNGTSFFVKYKLLAGTLIVGLLSVSGCKSKKEVMCYLVEPVEFPLEEVTCYKPALSTDIQENDPEETEIKGRIVNTSGEPLAGVMVTLKKVAIRGAVTDLSGNFDLVATTNDTLVFRFAGYIPQEIPVTKIKKENVQVVMEEEFMITCYESVVVKSPKQ